MWAVLRQAHGISDKEMEGLEGRHQHLLSRAVKEAPEMDQNTLVAAEFKAKDSIHKLHCDLSPVPNLETFGWACQQVVPPLPRKIRRKFVADLQTALDAAVGEGTGRAAEMGLVPTGSGGYRAAGSRSSVDRAVAS